MGRKSRAKRHESVAHPLSETAQAAPSRATRPYIAAALSAGLFIAVFAVYGQVAGHDFINYDDPIYVAQNDHVLTGLSSENIRWAFTSTRAALWLPLTWISYMIDVQLFGPGAGKHLLVNVFLHALNSVLLFLFFRYTTGFTWRSAIVAGLFALHPLHVESVAWVTERKDVLSTFFFLLSLWSYVRYIERRSPARYAPLVAAFVFGLMSKPMIVTLPFVLLLLDWWPLGRFNLANVRSLRPLIVEKIPLFLLVIPAVLVTLKTQKPAIAATIPLSDRLANAVTSYVAYLGKMIWPSDLAVVYPLRAASGVVTTLAVLFLTGITALLLYQARRCAFLAVGWLWYLGTLVPVIGIVQAGAQSMADRFVYVPLIGIYFGLVWLAGESVVFRRFAGALAAPLLIVLGVVSHVQASHWKDTTTLIHHALSVTRDNDVAHLLLGSELAAKGNHAAAEQELKKAVSINPKSAEAYQSLGRMKLSRQPEEAVQYLQKAADLEPEDLSTRAMLASALGNKQEAVTLFGQALQRGDDTADIHNDFAAVLAMTGRDAEAIKHYQEALRRMPAHYDARMNLGAVLSRLGRNEEAIREFSAAAQRRPDSPEPHVYIALVYASTGRFESAIWEMNLATSIDPVEANRLFTNAVRIPFKESNLSDYLVFLQDKRSASKDIAG